jgi:hypothetical protein
MQKRGLTGWNGKKLSTCPCSQITISPGSTSRTNSAPMMSSAQVSEASTQPSPIRPSISGRTPSASRTPISLVRVMATIEKAPSTRRSASFIRSGMVFWIERAIRWMMHSVSEPDWKIEPRPINSSRRLSALVRLPLWAMAQPPMANSAKSGCTSRSAADFEPAVE